jgi:hypothetical protein
MYDFVDLEIRANHEVEIRAVYYGSPKMNPILIWKQGADFPAASDAVEAQFQFDCKR